MSRNMKVLETLVEDVRAFPEEAVHHPGDGSFVSGNNRCRENNCVSVFDVQMLVSAVSDT